ncbi:uncharacterized protein LOC127812600 [Diospyros lotus]|uniref:uncharacterized protein LOC127812600 n=1 Tax=Diospyros lotus TaxID=55363 RepID=UPI00225A49BD|nr:uncharacterized protein LOC127812600 [Diospyros lotus]
MDEVVIGVPGTGLCSAFSLLRKQYVQVSADYFGCEVYTTSIAGSLENVVLVHVGGAGRCPQLDMVRGRRNKEERALSSSSRQRPTASRRRRRVEGTSEPLDVSEAIDPSLSEPHASPSVAIATEASQQKQPSDHDDISVGPLPGGPEDPSILKSFKNHVAFAI